MSKKQSGFTLIELIICGGVILLLAWGVIRWTKAEGESRTEKGCQVLSVTKQSVAWEAVFSCNNVNADGKPYEHIWLKATVEKAGLVAKTIQYEKDATEVSITYWSEELEPKVHHNTLTGIEAAENK